MDFAGTPVLPPLSVSLASTGDAGGCQDLVPQTRQDLGSWRVGLPLLSEPSQVLGSHLSTGCGRDLQTQGDRRAASESLPAAPARALREQTPHHQKRRSRWKFALPRGDRPATPPQPCPGYVTHHTGPSKAVAWKWPSRDTPMLELIALRLRRMRASGLRCLPGMWCETSSHVQQEHDGGGQRTYAFLDKTIGKQLDS